MGDSGEGFAENGESGIRNEDGDHADYVGDVFDMNGDNVDALRDACYMNGGVCAGQKQVNSE